MNDKNTVIILDITYGGYGVARALAKHHIPLIGFCPIDDTDTPEAKTKLADVKTYYSEGHLLNTLLEIADGQDLPPVLIFTTDTQVEFFNNNRDILEHLFLTNVPSYDITKELIQKDSFQRYAERNGWLVPKTWYLASQEDIQNITYPVFVKPTNKWKENLKGKMCHNHNEVKELFKYSDNFVAQQWIPGNTENILTANVYYDTDGKCVMCVTAKKLREWPIEAGSGCCMEIIKDNELTRVATSFFNQAHYQGFGSLEVKRHEDTGQYYLIEPTIGRVDLFSDFTTANGFNFPAYHYSLLTGLPLQNNLVQRKRPVFWIHEFFDIQSSMKTLKMQPFNIFKIIWTYINSKFHLFNISDPSPFWFFFRKKILKVK